MDAARQAVERHSDAINARNRDAYLATVAFPFTYQNYNGVALTIEAPREWGDRVPLPWDIILDTDPDWRATEFDQVDEVARSASSVVFKVGFRRISNDGVASAPYDAIWIVILWAGEWRVQFRHNLGLRL